MANKVFRPPLEYPEMVYSNANAYLDKRDSRKLQNHTYLQRRYDSSIAVRLWSTDVVTYKQDGSIVLNTGGWGTVTTKERLNDYNPWGSVWSDKGDWWYYNNGSKKLNSKFGGCYEFKSGMTIQSDGIPDTRCREVVLLKSLTNSEENLTESQAQDYVAGLDLKQVKRLVRNKYLRVFAISNCRKEYLPMFLGHEDLAKAISERLKT